MPAARKLCKNCNGIETLIDNQAQENCNWVAVNQRFQGLKYVVKCLDIKCHVPTCRGTLALFVMRSLCIS